MLCPECGNHAANKALQKLGIKEKPSRKVVELAFSDGTAVTPTNGAVISAGESYVLEVLGEKLKLTAKQATTEIGEVVYFGNLNLMGTETDEDESFVVCSFDNPEIGGWCVLGVAEIWNGETVTIRTTETITPISQKYLPDTLATKADIFGAMEASY